MKRCIALLVVLVACNGPKVNLEGDGSDAAPSPVVSTPLAEAGPTTPATCGYPVQSAECTYAGSCSDGAGYLVDTPGMCADATGPEESFTSIAQVAAALVGTWSACDGGSTTDFVQTLSQDTTAISFTSDGHFTLLTASDGSFQDLSLVPGTSKADSGTFEVLDASASLGAGTYQVRLSAGDGGVHATQVVIFESERRLRFFSPGASDYMLAPSKQYQANVCGPPFGTIDTPDDGNEALSRLQGKWARCPNAMTRSVFAAFEGEGLEFPGDGTWYALVEDSSGILVRATDMRGHGTITVVGSSPPTLTFAEGDGGPISFTDVPILGACGSLGWTQPNFVDPTDSGVAVTSFQYMRLP